VLCLLLAACGGESPADTPAAWFHDLEGGEIAAARPPPPGVGLPYPHIGTVPAKPQLPDAAFRRNLRDQLIAERDRTQRIASDTPLEVIPPPPKQAPPAQPGLAGAEPAATASLATADAPPAPPPKPVAAADAGVAGPAPGTPVTLAGSAYEERNLPVIPDAPPPPATFEGVAAEPPPSPPPPVPAGLPDSPGAMSILFPTGLADLPPSQVETIKLMAGKRGHQTIEVTGGGEAKSDSPDGQAAAIDLALKRAHAVAGGLEAQHVPPASIRLAAYAFGRGATIRLLP
jgi:hypothetical protein